MGLNWCYVSTRHLKDLNYLYVIPAVMKGHGLVKEFPPEFWFSTLEGNLTHLGTHWVLEDTDSQTIVGHGSISQWVPNKYTHEVYLTVHPRQWHKGLGRSILTRLSAECLKRGSKYLWASVMNNNSRSCSLFEQSGFLNEASMPHYGIDDVGDSISRNLYVKKVIS